MKPYVPIGQQAELTQFVAPHEIGPGNGPVGISPAQAHQDCTNFKLISSSGLPRVIGHRLPYLLEYTRGMVSPMPGYGTALSC